MLGISTYYARKYTTLCYDPLGQGHSYDVISVTLYLYVPGAQRILPSNICMFYGMYYVRTIHILVRIQIS